LDDGKERNLFKYEIDRTKPRWWMATFGWTSFMPLYPLYHGFPFDTLAYIPTPIHIEGEGYSMPSDLIQRWAELEHHMFHATASLSERYKILAICPFTPSAFGFGIIFQTPRLALQNVTRSRDWFNIWIGLYSYLISGAVAKAEKPGNLPIPHWFELLAEKGFNQTWLAGINSSIATSFLPQTQCIGAIVELWAASDKLQPPVETFCRYNIPGWYRWSDTEAGDRELDRYTPPPELLHKGKAMLERGIRNMFVSLGEASDIPRMPVPNVMSQPAPKQVSWQNFFRTRAERNARKLATETAGEQEKHLNRARNPPTRSAKVFEWLASDYDPNVLVRRPVVSSQRFDVLSSYTASQKLYDAFSNEWDCCKELSPDATLEDDMEDVVQYSTAHGDIDPETQDLPPPAIVHTPSAPSTSSTVAPPGSEEGEDEEYTIYPSDPLEVLCKFYGFVPSLSLRTGTSSGFREEGDWQKLLHCIGERNLPDAFVTSQARASYDFLLAFIEGKRPHGEKWDLDRSNRAYLGGSQRLHCLHRLQNDLFLFDFQCKSGPTDLQHYD
jgi:hypothetical protein